MAEVATLNFQKIIEADELWVSCDDNWKEYHHWLNTEAHCKNCGRMWKDREKDASGKHIGKPWPCEVNCGCLDRGDFSQMTAHLVTRRPHG